MRLKVLWMSAKQAFRGSLSIGNLKEPALL